MAVACHRVCDLCNDAVDRCLAVAFVTDDTSYGVLILLSSFHEKGARPALVFIANRTCSDIVERWVSSGPSHTRTNPHAHGILFLPCNPTCMVFMNIVPAIRGACANPKKGRNCSRHDRFGNQ